MDLDQYETLAIDIQNSIVCIPDVDRVLADTSQDLINVETLKKNAESVKTTSKSQLFIAYKIINDLSSAYVSQDATETAVGQARNDINSTKSNLEHVRSHILQYVNLKKFI